MAKNIVLVTNHLTPYRKSFYDKFHDVCEKKGVNFTVLLMTKREPKREWDYEKLKNSYSILMSGCHFSFPINNHLNWDVISYLKEKKPEIVILAGSYFYYTNWLVLLFKKKFKYSVYFWSETHLRVAKKHNKLSLSTREFVRKVIYPMFDGFWYSGFLSKELIQKYVTNKARMCFVPNLIDNNIYYHESRKIAVHKDELRAKWNIPIGCKILIIPARLSAEKGIEPFIDILMKIKLKKSFVVLIPGSGDLKDRIEVKIKESGLDIRLLGFQRQEIIIELYAMSDVFVLPSLSDANPLTCIEALWCGMPLVVSTHVGNYPEVIKEGVNGYVFDYDFPEDAVAKIEKIISANDDWFDKAKYKSHQIANEKYNPDNTVDRVVTEMINNIQ